MCQNHYMIRDVFLRMENNTIRDVFLRMENNTVNLLSVTNLDTIIAEIIHYSSEVWVRETKLCMSSKQDGNIGRNI